MVFKKRNRVSTDPSRSNSEIYFLKDVKFYMSDKVKISNWWVEKVSLNYVTKIKKGLDSNHYSPKPPTFYVRWEP